MVCTISNILTALCLIAKSLSFPCFYFLVLRGAYFRPDLSNVCSISNILFNYVHLLYHCHLWRLFFRPDLSNVCSISNILILLCSFALSLSGAYFSPRFVKCLFNFKYFNSIMCIYFIIVISTFHCYSDIQ